MSKRWIGAMALVLAALPSLALAQEASWMVSAGVSQSGHSDHGATPAVFVQHFASPHQGKSWSVQPVASLGVLGSRSDYTQMVSHDVWVVGGGLRLRHQRIAPRWFAEAQVMGSAPSTDELSGHIQFSTALGVTGTKWELSLRHLSNARLKQPNNGETMVLVGYRF